LSFAQAGDLDKSLEVKASGTKSSAKSQDRIDKTADETGALLAEFRATLAQIDSLRIYNRQLEMLIESQKMEMASLDEQIDNVTVVGRQITPLMLKMVDAIDAFVELDVPFLPNERENRVANLRAMMTRADVGNSEKYRRIMEAYQIENDYGRTLGTYKGDLDFDGTIRKVDFLRLGRASLVYQTPDGQELGAWDSAKGEWVSLPRGYRNAIRKGIRIAHKQAAPDLIRLPVSAPEDRR
jgi:hypothetical protein